MEMLGDDRSSDRRVGRCDSVGGARQRKEEKATNRPGDSVCDTDRRSGQKRRGSGGRHARDDGTKPERNGHGGGGGRCSGGDHRTAASVLLEHTKVAGGDGKREGRMVARPDPVARTNDCGARRGGRRKGRHEENDQMGA